MEDNCYACGEKTTNHCRFCHTSACDECKTTVNPKYTGWVIKSCWECGNACLIWDLI